MSKTWVHDMNKLGASKTPFVFLADFELNKVKVFKEDQAAEENLYFEINDSVFTKRNFGYPESTLKGLQLSPEYVDFKEYEKAFKLVHKNLKLGNSFLTNLTAENKITSSLTLKELFFASFAKYKVMYKNEFLCFSPETFVQINNEGIIASFPMKGTIKASEKNAKQTLLNDTKELHEHTTIVDLIRNDISKVAEKVWVERFRYFDTIITQKGEEILQLSSEIKGQLPKKWEANLGSIISELLPAGSISGAPKDKTIEIIKEAESNINAERGYYTGVFGYFNGETFSSAVLIRYIEQKGDQLLYKSGGGLTSNSELKKEYEELKTKIYVPLL